MNRERTTPATPDTQRAPVRTCVGCRQRFDQRLLVRSALLADGSPVVSRTAAGRGAWVCSIDCVDRAIKRRGYERAWRRPVDAGALASLRDDVLEAALTNVSLQVAAVRSDHQTPRKG